MDVGRHGWWRGGARGRPPMMLGADSKSPVQTALRSAGTMFADMVTRMVWQASAAAGQLSGGQSAELVSLRQEAGTAKHAVSTTDTAVLPELTDDQPCTEPQLFALVDATNPNTIHYYGLDLGNAAFTVRSRQAGVGTNFGSWISMHSAFERLDRMAGPYVRLALVMYDSVPVMVTAALGSGWPGRPGVLEPAPVPELDGPTTEHPS